MTTILIKKKDTAGAPAAGDLTNAAGGAEIAVNTATKRIYTKDSGGNVVETGTNPSILNVDNIQIDVNTISSTDTNGNINLTPNGTGSVVISKLNVTGAITFDGNVTVGNSSSDTLTVNSTITSNLIFTDNTYDIGALGATRPRNLYVGTSITVASNGTYGMYAYNSTNTRKVWFATSSVNTIFYNTDSGGGISFRNAADTGTLAYLNDGGALLLGGTETNVTASPKLYIAMPSNGTSATFGYANFFSAGTNNGGFALGAYYNGSAWTAQQTSATFYQQYLGSHQWWANAGLTVGNTFSESKVMTVDYTGYLLNQSTVAAGVVRHESLNLSTAANSTADFVARVGNASSSYVQIQATQAGAGYLTFGAGQTSGNIIVVGNYSLNIQTNSLNRMAVANDGRVAIGYANSFAQGLNENQLTVWGSANVSGFVTTGGVNFSPILTWNKAALSGGTGFLSAMDLLAGASTYTSYGNVGTDGYGNAGIKSNINNVVLDSYTGATNFHYRGNNYGIEISVDGLSTGQNYIQSYDRGGSAYRSLGILGSNINFYNSSTAVWSMTSNNIVAQVNNAGIQFKNTSGLTNSVLNDYETGNWTLAMTFGGTACTNNSQTCTYTKVGRTVIATVQGSGWTRSTGGNINVTGLPFSSVGTYSYGYIQFNAYNSVIYSVMPYISGTGSRMLAQAPDGSTSGHRDLAGSDLPLTFNMYGVFVYEANF